MPRSPQKTLFSVAVLLLCLLTVVLLCAGALHVLLRQGQEVEVSVETSGEQFTESVTITLRNVLGMDILIDEQENSCAMLQRRVGDTWENVSEIRFLQEDSAALSAKYGGMYAHLAPGGELLYELDGEQINSLPGGEYRIAIRYISEKAYADYLRARAREIETSLDAASSAAPPVDASGDASDIPDTTPGNPSGDVSGNPSNTPSGDVSGNPSGDTSGNPSDASGNPSGDTPGSPGNTPGSSGDTSGDTPGSPGDTSGNAPGSPENAPGSPENSPSSPDNAPGSSGNAPSNPSGNAPGSPENTPGSPSGTTSGSSGNAPGSSGDTSNNALGSSGNTSGKPSSNADPTPSVLPEAELLYAEFVIIPRSSQPAP